MRIKRILEKYIKKIWEITSFFWGCDERLKSRVYGDLKEDEDVTTKMRNKKGD